MKLLLKNTIGDGTPINTVFGVVQDGEVGAVVSLPVDRFLEVKSILDATANISYKILSLKITEYGAKGNAIADDHAAIQAAYTAALLQGGGTVIWPAGKYRVTDQIVNGYKFVTETDIDITTADFTTVASFDSGQFSLATSAPCVHTIFEAGAVLWCDFSGDLAGIYNGITAQEQNGSGSAIRYENVTIIGQDAMSSGGTFLFPSSSSAPTTLVEGIFAAGARMLVTNYTARDVRRGLTLCSCFWSLIESVNIFYSNFGVVAPGSNAVSMHSILTSYAYVDGLEITGQGFEVEGFFTEECTRAFYAPEVDGGKLTNTYIEAVGSGLTGYQMQIGDGTNTVDEFHVENSHLSSLSGKSCHLLNHGQMSVGPGTHWYPDAAHGLLMDTGSVLWQGANVSLALDPTSDLDNYTQLAELIQIPAGLRIGQGQRDTTHTGQSGIQFGRAGLFCNPSTNMVGIVQDNSDIPQFQVETFSGRIVNNGACDFGVQLINIDFTLDTQEHYILSNVTGGSITLTLPVASGCPGREYVVKKTDAGANTVSLVASGSDTIEGTTAVLTTQFQFIKLISDGVSNWSKF